MTLFPPVASYVHL